MEIPFLSNLAFVTLAFLLTYAAGTGLLSLAGSQAKGFTGEFQRMATGIWTLTAGYSLLRTGGVTLSLALLPIGICWWYRYRPLRPVRPAFHWKRLAAAMLILLLVFVLLYLEVFDPVQRSLYYFSIDLPVQASQVEKLVLNGIESTHTDLVFREAPRDLYHYGDLWYPAVFVQAFGMNAMAAVYFTYAAVTATAILLGALAILETVKGTDALRGTDLLLALGFLALSGISFYIPKSGWLDARWGEHFNLFALTKAYLVVLSVLWAVLYLLKRDLYACTLALLAVVPLYIVAAPALLLAWASCLLFAVWQGDVPARSAFVSAVPVLLVCAIIGVYILANRSAEAGFILNIPAVTVSEYIRSAIYTMRYTGVRVLLALLPFLLLLVWKRREILRGHTDSQMLVFLLSGIASSVFIYGLFYFQVDGFQLWTVPNAALSALLVFFILLRLRKQNLLKVAILLLCLYQNKVAYTDREYYRKPYAYDRSFVACMLEQLGPGDAPGMALMRKPVTRANDPLWGSDPNIYYPYDLVKWSVKNYHPITLTLLDTELSADPGWADFQQGYIRNSAFFRFTEKQRREGRFVSVEQSQAEFIREQSLRFVLFEPGALPNAKVDSLVRIVCRDETTGYRLGEIRQAIPQ